MGICGRFRGCFTRRSALALVAATGLVGAGGAGLAAAKTSHAGWPRIDGKLIINRTDSSDPIAGLPAKHNELLGGHGDDTITAGKVGDVLWGDYKPTNNNTTQVDHIDGGAGKDFIYASHGRNVIDGRGGADQIHAHFGRGSIRCASSAATVFLSHRSQPGYKLTGCKHISFASVGH